METPVNNSSYIEEIEALAARKGYSVTKFLGLIGIDDSHYHKWKRGEVRPRPETIQGIRTRARAVKKV